MKVTLDERSIQSISLFQRITGAHIVDSILEDDTIYFVVKKGQYGMSVGKNGERIKKAEGLFNKKIRIFEHADTLEEFLKNAIPEAKKIDIKSETVEISVSNKERSKVLGKNGERVKILNQLIERLYGKKPLKILAPVRL